MGSIWDKIKLAFWEHKHDRSRISKHRKGRQVTATKVASRKAKRRARNKAASAMRAIQRRRDRQSAKRQR